MRKLPAVCLAVVVLAAAAIVPLASQDQRQQPPFRLEEATIAGIHAAMKSGRLTCRALVDQYLRRIAVYDKNGPAVNAIVQINERATTEADELDRRFDASGLTGPLHCIPAIVKDNFETVGLQSAAG